MEAPALNSAPYGWACAECVRVKCKCLKSDNGVCARCARLKKECRPAPRVRKSNQGRVSKTATLERKLDGLMSLLQGTTGQPPTQTCSSASSASGLKGSSEGLTTAPDRGAEPFTLPDDVAQFHPTCQALSKLHHDEEILTRFRTEKLPYLPVVHIPTTTSAAELKKTSPFLWRCIVTAQCGDYEIRAALYTELREAAAKELLLDLHRSLELLQGILVYLAWVTFACVPHKATLSPYVHMATSLVFDLGLDKPAPQQNSIAIAHRVAPAKGPHGPWVSRVRTMDQRRAVVACFMLCSSIMTFLGRTDNLRWTAHMEECLEVLARSTETPNDAVLVRLVRTQLVIDKVSRVVWKDDDRDVLTMPPSFYITALQSQLRDIRNQLSPELIDNKLILLHLHHAEVSVYETTVLTPPAHTTEVDLARIENLYACLSAIQGWFQLLFEIPLSSFASFPTSLIFPIAHCLISLSRLTTLDCPGWDKAMVRRTIDVLCTTQKVIERLETTSEAAGIRHHGTESDPFRFAARVLRDHHAAWACKLAEGEGPPPVNADPAVMYPEPHEHISLDSWLEWPNLAWLAESGGTL